MADICSRKRASTQTMLAVCAVIVITLIGLSAESTFQNDPRNIKVHNLSQRTTKRPPSTINMKPDKSFQTWLGIYVQMSKPHHLFCQSSNFNKVQKKICKQNKEFSRAFTQAARSAIHQCQVLFRNHRWNCAAIDQNTFFGNLLKLSTRETAFVYAIASASLTTVITKACSSGDMKTCYCEKNYSKSPAGSIQSAYEKAGCSDNVHFGVAFSRSFVDGAEKNPSAKQYTSRTLMNLHNNEVGRQIVQKSLKQECKCIGISGSCTTSTCAKLLPKFDVIAPLVKEKYDSAVKVLERLTSGSKRELVPADPREPPVKAQQIVHLQDSYDFCEANLRMGSMGTRGRLCNSTSTGEGSCSYMCCSRNYNVIKYKQQIDCNCVFKFCCKIECQKCEADITENRCK